MVGDALASGLDKLKEVFLRPRTEDAVTDAAGGLPANVIPLRPTGGDVLRSRPRSAVLPAMPRRDDGLAPEVIVVGMDGRPELWLSLALARALRRRLGMGAAFVVDPLLDRECGAGEARLGLGTGRVTLPFAARRHGSDMMRVGEGAAGRHGPFLRALGPLVWNLAGAGCESEELIAHAREADGVVLARPLAVESAYAVLVADELRAAGVCVPVVRALVHPAATGDTGDPAVSAGASLDLRIPAGAFDRWRVEHGLGCGAATTRAVESIAGVLV